MHKPGRCEEVRFHLARHGLPTARLERVTRELTEHWEDLCAAGLEQGLSPTAAAVAADVRLGKPKQLAATIIIGLRRSSWLGRHPVLTVCVVPLLLPLAVMAAIIFPWFGSMS